MNTSYLFSIFGRFSTFYIDGSQIGNEKRRTKLWMLCSLFLYIKTLINYYKCSNNNKNLISMHAHLPMYQFKYSTRFPRSLPTADSNENIR